MHEIDRLGMTRVMEEAIAHVSKDTDGVHLSFDLDALDPLEAPGVGTPVKGGITYRESHLAMEMLAEADIITSAEFVEVNPILDQKNQTAEAAVALIGSLLWCSKNQIRSQNLFMIISHTDQEFMESLS